jgi:hypothetical protein
MVNDSGVAVRPDSVAVEFDDERLVANAGVMLTSTLINRLGLERLVEETVDLGQRPGAAKPGRKVCSLVHAMALGADSIDDCDVLRAGGTEVLLGHRVLAPSTLGTFLRSFSFGHVRQLDRVLAESIRRAWSAGAESPRSRAHGRLLHRAAAAQPGEHDLDLLLRRPAPIRALLAQPRLLLGRAAHPEPGPGQPLRGSAPPRPSGEPKPSSCQHATRERGRARMPPSCQGKEGNRRRLPAAVRSPVSRPTSLLPQRRTCLARAAVRGSSRGDPGKALSRTC